MARHSISIEHARERRRTKERNTDKTENNENRGAKYQSTQSPSSKRSLIIRGITLPLYCSLPLLVSHSSLNTRTTHTQVSRLSIALLRSCASTCWCSYPSIKHSGFSWVFGENERTRENLRLYYDDIEQQRSNQLQLRTLDLASPRRASIQQLE